MFSPTQHDILRLLSRAGPVNRTALAARSGLSKPAVTVVTRELIGLGLVEEISEPGARSRPLRLRAAGAWFVGVSLAECEAVLVASDLAGTPLVHRRLAMREGASGWTPEALVDAVAHALPERLAGQTGPSRGVGVSVSGVVDLAGRQCVQSTRLGWSDVPLAVLLEERIGVPVRLENDANALARGMQMFGPLRGSSSFSLVSVDQGIGCGHIVDGRLLRGGRGGAGEIAHATVRPDGAPCRCGKLGCLDTVASLRAIAEAATAAGLPAEIGALQRLAEGGRADAVRVLHEAGSMLGLGLAQMIQSLDPGWVTIGIDPALAGGIYGAAARRAVSANVLGGFAGSDAGEPIRFVTVSPTAWAEGAAGVAAHWYLCGTDS